MIHCNPLDSKSPTAVEAFKHVHEKILVPAFAGTRLKFDYDKMLSLFLNESGKNPKGLHCQLYVTVAKDNDGETCGAAHWLSFDDPPCAFHLYTSVPEKYRNGGIAIKLQEALYKQIKTHFGKEVPVYVELRKQVVHKKPELLQQLSLHELRFDYQFMNDDFLNKNWLICAHGVDKINKSDFKKALQRQAEFYVGKNFTHEEAMQHPSLRLIDESLKKTPGDYIVAKPYSHELKNIFFLPSDEVEAMAYTATPEEFELIKSGKTRSKPKILINPATREMYRLVPKDSKNSGYKNGYYVKTEPNHSIIDCYELSGEALKQAASKNLRPLPEGYEIRSFVLQQDENQPLRKHEVSYRQLYELLTSVGVDSNWWPIEDPTYQAKKYFKGKNINILFHDDFPIGLTMWDESKLKTDKSVMGSFLGILPREKGKGLGGYLFDWGLKQIVQKGAQRRLLVTSPQDVMTKRDDQATTPRVKEMYEKRGFTHLGTQTFAWESFTPDESLLYMDIPNHLSKFNAPEDFTLHPDTGQRMGRYSQAECERRISAAFTGSQKIPF